MLAAAVPAKPDEERGELEHIPRLVERVDALAARHRTNARSRLRCRQVGPEPETARKTTAFLPGQIASAPAADRDGVVVRSNGDDRFCLFPERSSGALSLAIAVGRDGRDAATMTTE